MRSIRTRMALPIAAFAIAALVTPVAATNLLNLRAGGDSTVWFNKVGLGALVNGAVGFNDTNSIEPTDISTTIVVDQPEREVNIFDQWDDGSGFSGWYACVQWAGYSTNAPVCATGYVSINTIDLGGQANLARSLVCEEVGHSVGLDHRPTDATTCMQGDWDPIVTMLNAHDKGHLNARY